MGMGREERGVGGEVLKGAVGWREGGGREEIGAGEYEKGSAH